MKVKKAIIPAAGLGTRFLPATKAQPKEMLPLEGRRFDVGDKLGFIQATIDLALGRPELRLELLAFMEELLAKEQKKA